MNLNLFEYRKIIYRHNENNGINKFIKELAGALKRNTEINKNNQNTVLEEYDIYEKKKIFLDNKTRHGNDLAWVMDEHSICISENGDGGPVAANEVLLPKNRKIGEVYEKINGKYIYNSDITEKLNKL